MNWSVFCRWVKRCRRLKEPLKSPNHLELGLMVSITSLGDNLAFTGILAFAKIGVGSGNDLSLVSTEIKADAPGQGELDVMTLT